MVRSDATNVTKITIWIIQIMLWCAVKKMIVPSIFALNASTVASTKRAAIKEQERGYRNSMNYTGENISVR